MKTFLVANPKGGSGKSTLATHLAAYFAHAGQQVMLGDIDRQHSAREWLASRPAHLPAIATWDIGHDHIARPPGGPAMSCWIRRPGCAARCWTRYSNCRRG